MVWEWSRWEPPHLLLRVYDRNIPSINLTALGGALVSLHHTCPPGLGNRAKGEICGRREWLARASVTHHTATLLHISSYVLLPLSFQSIKWNGSGWCSVTGRSGTGSNMQAASHVVMKLWLLLRHSRILQLSLKLQFGRQQWASDTGLPWQKGQGSTACFFLLASWHLWAAGSCRQIGCCLHHVIHIVHTFEKCDRWNIPLRWIDECKAVIPTRKETGGKLMLNIAAVRSLPLCLLALWRSSPQSEALKVIFDNSFIFYS